MLSILVRYPRRITLILFVVGVVAGLPGTTPASVTPVTLIERQLIKPNILLVFDTSTSMINSPGDKDYTANEVGMDCENGDANCRPVGWPGRCFYSGGGAMGSGLDDDPSMCHNDAECRVGYCNLNKPTTCDGDNDNGCSTYCKGFCSNNNNTACNRNSDCGSGNKCRGICASSANLAIPKCTSDADCEAGDFCTPFSYDFCATTATGMQTVKMCAAGRQRCRVDSDCSASIAGDTCGPATSRLVTAKRVVKSMVSAFYNRVNFGLMTYYQKNYYPYYKVSGSIVNHDITRFMDRDMLKAAGCWTKQNGPAPTCTINGENHNRRNNPDSQYKIKIGADTFTLVDSNWCGNWCSLPTDGGTGHYFGSYYTMTDPQATLTATLSTQTTYQGKTLTIGSDQYVYWDPPYDTRNVDGYYYRTRSRPIGAGSYGSSATACTATGGGRGDTTVAPFMNTTNNAAAAQAMANAILAKMDKAGLGGVAAEGSTPTGCTLAFDPSSSLDTTDNNALSYMTAVKAADTLPCRSNYVLLLTDGQPHGTMETACDSTGCSSSNPAGNGCQCRTVLAAQQLMAAGVKVFVVGFSGALSTPYATATLNNTAKAGGTTTAYFATREEELRDALVSIIYAAAAGSYTTSPATASSGVQAASGQVTLGNMLLDTRVDFPGWRGNLVAYNTATSPISVLWNAATVAFDYNVNTGKYFTSVTPVDRRGDWKKRNIWTSNGTSMVKFDVNQSTGAITNKSTLKTLGLGATDDEAERVAKFMLGDPTLDNPAVLGGLINSSPIDIGPAGKSTLPGGEAFYQLYKDRPYLTYVGSSDGMVHAFFTKATTVGSTTYPAGAEAFAYIPQTMLSVALKLYAQGGQLPDPNDHIYGLANSPKVKSLCTANCTDAATAVWKTLMVMTYGWGGTEAFVLDVTNPFDGGGVKSSTTTPPAPLVWSTQYLNSSMTSAYDNTLGLTTSVPAFYYAKTATRDDFRVVFGSYTTDPVSGQLAKVLLNSSVINGSITDSKTINPSNSCTQTFGLMSDVATARNNASGEETQIVAAYFGDTWGTLYRYVPGVSGTQNYTGTSGSVSTVEAFTCNHPVHYSPTVVQLDRDNPTNHPGEIYLVQVTNSALDLATKDFPASKMVIRKDLASAPGVVNGVSTFGTGGKIELSIGGTGTLCSTSTTGACRICGVTSTSGSCTEALPSGARPNSTPTAVLRSDGQGFIVLATWYVPAVDGCNDGTTYITVFDLDANTTNFKQRFGKNLISEPVTSTVFVGGKLMFAAQAGVTDLTPLLPSGLAFNPGQIGDRYRRTGWTERP